MINLVLLSLLFTAGAGGAMWIRKGQIRGHESIMCIIWAVLLTMSIIPMYSNRVATAADSTVSHVTAANDTLRTQQPDNDNIYTYDTQRDIALAKMLYGDYNTAIPTETGSSNNNKSDVQPDISDSSIVNTAVTVLFCVWIAGTAFSVLRTLSDYHVTKKLLLKNSQPYQAGNTADIFSECREIAGLKRAIELRIVCSDFPCSPCVIGIFRPIIFISGECQNFTDRQLRFVLTHELCHIKRHDTLFKLFALFVTSIHWFNPIAHIVYREVTEDCELACDNAVLTRLGRQNIDNYMFTILDIAERLCASKQSALANRLDTGLFLSGSYGKRFLERRYRNMKNVRKNKFTLITTSLFIIIALAVNIMVMSSCGYPIVPSISAASGNSGTGNVFLDEAIRGYNGLTNDEIITADMITGIETLVIRASDYTSLVNDTESLLVDYIVNGKEILPFPHKIESARYTTNYAEVVYAYYLENGSVEDKTDADSVINKLNAFMAPKNYYDPMLTDEGKAEMLANYPDVIDYPEGYYLYDPYATARETAHLSNYLESAGLYANYTLTDDTFDASALNKLTSLNSVVYMGVTPVNEQLPEGCTSEYAEYSYNDISYNAEVQVKHDEAVKTSGTPQYGDSKGVTATFTWNGEEYEIGLCYGMYETEKKGVQTNADGNEYVALNCKALEAAITEYFVMPFTAETRLTPEHLAQITSIEAVIRTDLDYLYDESMELHGGHYIEFTINGEKQGLIPVYYNENEFLSGKISDSFYVEGFYELVENDGNSYYQMIREDEARIIDTYKEVANINGMKSLITEFWDEDGDGISDPVAEIRISDCIAARYVNTINTAENELTLDKELFPNLKSFTFSIK